MGFSGEVQKTHNVNQNSPALARGYLDAITGQCALADQDGKIVCINADWENFARANDYGAGDEESVFGLGANYLAVCESASGDCANEASSVAAGIRSVLSGEVKEFALEYPCHSPTERRWFKLQARALNLFPETQDFVLIQHVDVTEQVLKRLTSEFERAQLDNKLMTLIETAPIRIAVLDRELKYQFANQAFCDGVGMGLETLREKHVGYVLHADSLRILEPLMYKALAGQRQTCELPVKLMNDSEIDAVVSYLPDNSDPDRISGIYVIVQDISELKMRENDLRDAIIRADKASAAKSDFLACMSHELRTPLNAVIGFSDLLITSSENEAVRANVEKYARNIKGSGEILLNMVERLLDLSAIQAGRYEIRPDHYAFGDVADQCRMSIEGMARSKGLSVSIAAPPSPPMLWGDAASILQILTNLLTNSVKFTQRGGITLGLEILEESYVLSVEDTGAGMSPVLVKALNQPTTELSTPLPIDHGRTEGEVPGWGLGFSICRDLVSLHGGSIEIRSEEGVGTKVSVTLALA